VKRSRGSEYDKKRNRSKKHSERKFSFNNTSKASDDNSASSSEKASASTPKPKAASNSNTQYTNPQKRFEINEKQEKKYTYTDVEPKKNSSFLGLKIIVTLVIIAVSLVRIAISFKNMDSSKNTAKTQREVLKNMRRNDRAYRTSSLKATDFVVGKGKRIREVMQLRKDSTFPIIDHVNIRLFKGFHLYDPAPFPYTEILAKFAKYYFFYDRVEKSPTLSMSGQWEKLRSTSANRVTSSLVSHEEVKNYTYKGLQIEEQDFKVLFGEGELHGVATLVEFENTRYFFQFIAKEKTGTYYRRTFLRKYLNFYLKIR